MNLGIIREYISKSLLNNDLIKVKKFINVIKTDKGLMEELSFYGLVESLQNDNNTNFIIKESVESLDKYNQRKTKIKNLVSEFHNKHIISEENNTLYAAINVLVENKYKKQPTNKIVESYKIIGEYIKSKPTTNLPVNESLGNYKKLFPFITKQLTETYKDKFNENETKLINVIINGTLEEKKFMFEEIKERSLDMIENISEEEMDNEMKTQTIDKINEMNCDDINKMEENMLTLHELLDNDVD